MVEGRRQHRNRVVAIVASIALVVGLTPLPAAAASGSDPERQAPGAASAVEPAASAGAPGAPESGAAEAVTDGAPAAAQAGGAEAPETSAGKAGEPEAPEPSAGQAGEPEAPRAAASAATGNAGAKADEAGKAGAIGKSKAPGKAGEGAEPAKAEHPAFKQSVTVDNVAVTVEADAGAFPEGAALSVASVPSSAAEAAIAPERGAGENVAVSYTFDIKVLDAGGAELQPAGGRSVRVSFAAAEVADPNLEVSVYRVSGGEAEELAVSESGSTATAESNGFSYYTVEFTYGDLQYVLPGGGSVPLADVLTAVGLQGEPTDAASSAPELFSVEKGDGVWTVAARKAFHTEETLTVTINGTDYAIEVTDDDGSTGYDLVNGIPASEGGYVWMGGESPVKWHVIGKNGSNWLLISSDLIGGSSNTMNWHISNYNCQKTLSGFSEAEQAAVPATTKSEPEDYQYESKYGYFGRSPVNAKMFLLSAEEAETYFSSDAARQPGLWWLRSPFYNNDHIAGAVYSDGRVISYTNVYNDSIFGARPAFQLNLSSVLFSSAAEGGKSSAAAGSGDFGTINKTSGDGDNEIKLTLTDSARSGFSASTETSVASPGGTLDVSYSEVTNGDNVSALLCDESGEILYYASKTPEASGEGTWSMTIPAGLAKGSYTLKVFSEQQNGDKKTDYASPVSEIALNVTILYTVTFVDEDGTTVLKDAKEYPAGTAAEDIEKPADPTKEATAQYTYTFATWTPEVVAVTGDATYKAKYDETPRLYSVKWLNDDGTEFYRDVKVPYGTMPKFEGATPTKPSDDKYAYEFAGWEPAIAAVTGDATYTAKFTATPKDKPAYEVVSGAGGAWTQGSSAPLTFKIERTVDPETAFGHFTGVLVDGNAVPEKDASGKANWTARSGSVIVELQPSYLATLPAGAHTISALFDDADPAVADFKVSAKAATPATGDPLPGTAAVLAVVALAALGAAVAAFVVRRRIRG